MTPSMYTRAWDSFMFGMKIVWPRARPAAATALAREDDDASQREERGDDDLEGFGKRAGAVAA